MGIMGAMELPIVDMGFMVTVGLSDWRHTEIMGPWSLPIVDMRTVGLSDWVGHGAHGDHGAPIGVDVGVHGDRWDSVEFTAIEPVRTFVCGA